MRLIWVGVLSLFVALTGCNGAGGASVSADCLPEEKLSYPEASPEAKSMSVYIDTSISSTNFGKSRLANGASPFANLLLWIERVPVADSATLFGFARDIAPITEADLGQISRGVGRVCADCGFDETRLDRLLGFLADEEEPGLALVLTDLWFMSTEIEGSGALAMRRSVQKIFGQGRAIGIFGFEAPHTSEVYDLPGAAPLPANKIRSRPYFVLIVGNPHQVVATAEQIQREAMSETPGIATHFALYTPQLVASRPAATSFMGGLSAVNEGGQTIVRQADAITRESRSLELDRIAFNPNAATQASYEASGGTKGVLGPTAAPSGGWSFEGAPQVGKTSLEVQSWRNSEIGSARQCNRENWRPADYPEALLLKPDQNLQLDLSARSISNPNTDWILLRYEIKAAGLQENNEATQWLKEWSFSQLGGVTEPGASVDIANPPEIFPVLNLSAFARVLEAEMARAVEGQTIGHGQIILIEG